MKIHEVGAEVFHEDGRTDGEKEEQTDMTKLITVFRNFAKKKHKKLLTYKRLLNNYQNKDVRSSPVSYVQNTPAILAGNVNKRTVIY